MRHDNNDALLPWKAHIRGGWGRQIFSWKDIFQIDDEDDYPDKNELSDKIRETLH